MTIQDYLNLLTSSWRNKPKYTTMITATVSVQVRVQDLLNQMMTTLFDLDLPPVGDQLDIIGKWVGVSREIPVPISGVFFTWDGTDSTLGWDFGSWSPPDNPVNLTSLPDDAYLTLIKAKIAANQWDGTTDGAYEIWDNLFSNITILIVDNLNMSFGLAVIGSIIDSLTVAIITQGLIPLKPEGIRISEYYFSVDSNPAFAWDVPTTDLLAGWDTGSWLREIISP